MAKPWNEVSQSEAFLSLTPEQKVVAQQQYFNEVVAPRVPQDKLDIARQQFISENPLPDAIIQAPQGEIINPMEDLDTQIQAGVQGAANANPQIGVMEAGATLASAFGSSIAGGLKGLFTLAASGGDLNEAVNAVEDVQSEHTYSPRSTQGKMAIESITSAAAEAGKALNFFPSRLYGAISALSSGDAKMALEKASEYRNDPAATRGNDVLNLTGSPELAALADVAPDIMEYILPAGVFKASKAPINAATEAKRLKQVEKFLEQVQKSESTKTQLMVNGRTDANFTDDIMQRIAQKDLEIEEAAAITNEIGGRVVKNRAVNQAVRQGFKEPTVGMVGSMNAATKLQVQNMIDLAKRNLSGNSLFRSRNRLLGVAGDNLQKRYEFIQNGIKTRGARLDDVAESLKSVEFDPQSSLDYLEAELFKVGARIAREKSGSPIFKENGDIELIFEPRRPISAVSAANDREMLTNVISQLAKGEGGFTARDAHVLKRDIQSLVNFDNPNRATISEGILKGLQNKINETIRANSKDYADVNDELSDMIGVRNDLEKMFREIANDDLSQGVGVTMRKIDTNYAAGDPMRNLLQRVDEVANRYGGNFQDNLEAQVILARELEDLLKLEPAGTFSSRVSQGVIQGVDAVTQGNTAGIAQLLDSGVSKAMGKTPEKAVKALEDLIND